MTLTWNNNRNAYETPYGDNRTLFVDGDAFAEARREAALDYLAEKHPELDEKTLKEFADEHYEDDDVAACFDKAENELMAPDIWANVAVEVNEHGERTDGQVFDYDAWIEQE